MRCKHCRREIQQNSIFCNWCGAEQITRKTEIPVPKPRKLKNGQFSAQVMCHGMRITVTEDSEEMYYSKARAIKTEAIAAEKISNKSVAHCITEYIDARTNISSPSTIRDYKQKQKHHFQALQRKKVSGLTLPELQSAINAEARTFAPKTVINAWGLVSAAIKPYIRLDLHSIRLPTKEARVIPVYDDNNLVQLFQAVKGDDIELAVYLAACLGLRRSEILALKPDCFDRNAGTVTIHRAVVPDENNELVEKTTKTAKSARVISCPSFIFDLVPDTGNDYIYSGHKQNYILERLKRICQRNGLPDITLHGLRHSNASLMLKLMPDKYAMARGGWASDRVMKNVYQHTFSPDQEKYNHLVDEHFIRLKATAELLSAEKKP